jgi:hypothetical protein
MTPVINAALREILPPVFDRTRRHILSYHFDPAPPPRPAPIEIELLQRRRRLHQVVDRWLIGRSMNCIAEARALLRSLP